ncbi:MFS-type transporter clz9-like [Coccinella septempunctata]|uniref:MFS-type transporter clz9-like n=1 Tax=Coccinella septempunctata TaxID=41139 RepID=UPI001D080DAD|nr:MFS-type transporter clz9-like [Coccinella septempunctata]
MKLAIQEVLDGKKGYKSASKAYNVPQTTLERKVNQARKRENGVQNVKVPLGPITTVFSEEEEQILVDYLKEMEGRLFGLSTSEFQKSAYELAVRNNKQHKFNALKEKAGKDWLRGFLNRHPDLSLRKPENTSAARAAGFNRVSVGKFFELLGKTLDDNRFTPDRIYNCDETGVSVVPKSRSKLIAATGKKQVGALTSAERGTTITIEICFNATGSYLPPMFIYPRKRMKPELLNGAPPNSWAECSDSGWITAEIFLRWFQKFVILTNASKTNPVMLILDGHATHTQNLQLIDEARKYGVTIICFPPHTTHKLQPADVGFMRPLSIFYDQALTAWLRSSPGKVVSQFQVAELFGQAFIRAATMLTAINAFKACGISPYNPHIFTEDNFIAAEATEIELNAEKEPEADTTPTLSIAATSQRTLTVLPTITSSPPDTQTATHTTINSSANTLPHPTATTSYVVQQASVNDSLDNAAFHLVSPKQLMPYPRMAEKKTRQVRRRGKAAIITASPYKTELEEKQNSRKPKPDVSSEKKMKKSNKRSRKTKKAEEEAQTSEKEDTACLYCHGLYSESTEGWITCQVCSNWAHCGCAGVEDNDDESVHICPLCEDED